MATGGSLIGALRVTLGLDSSQFEAGTRRARQVAQRDVRSIQTELTKVRQGFESLRNAAVATALGAAAKRALEYASSLGEVAQQTGVTTKELQEYRYVASQVGVSNDEMDKSLQKLTRTIGEAKAGSKEQASVFRDLGVAIQDANGRVYTAGEIIPKLADALSRIKDPATRARYEVDLFGKAGQKLDTLLAGGSAAVNELRDAAEKLGIALSDEQIQRADETADKLSALKQVLEARIAGVVADNANAILMLANALAQLAARAAQVASTYPQATGAIVGALGGARVAGLPGAVIGAAGGLVAGEYAAQSRNDANMDVRFRSKALKDAIAKWRGAKGTGGAAMSTMGMNGGISSGVGSDAAAWKEVERQWGLFNQAKASSALPKLPAVTVPDGALPSVAGGGGKGRGGRGPKDRSAEYLDRYNREIQRLGDDELELRERLSTDARERAMFEHQRLDAAHAAYLDDVKTREAAGELTHVQAESLRLQSEENKWREAALINRQLEAELDREDLDTKRAQLESANTLLKGELDGARTQVDRRRIQLQMLENEKELERLGLEQVIASKDTSDAQRAIAQAKLDQLDKEYGQQADAIKRDTMGPMAQYLDSLPRTADDLREKFESIRVDALNNSLDVATRNVVRLKGVAGDLFNQLISDVIRFNLQAMLTGGGNGIFGSIGKFLGMSSGLVAGDGANGAEAAIGQILKAGPIRLPGLANGGTFRAGGIGGIDRNVLAINGVPRVRVSANENITVTPANANAPVARVLIEEAPSFASRVVGISGGVVVESAKTNYRRGRQRLDRY